MIPEGWHYVPHGSAEPVQVIAPLIGGYDDGNAVEIGAAEELPDHLEVPGNEHMHYYALEHRGCYGLTHHALLWVYVFVLSERRAAK
jgi:hypothetical protein